MAEENQPQATVPTTQPPTSEKRKKLKSLNVNKLGIFLDGWADLVETRSDKVDEVKGLVLQYLIERYMPEVEVEQVEGSVGIGTKKRPYNITTTHPSATTAIYVGDYGQDLYVSWRTFIKPQLSAAVAIMIILSVLAGVYWAFRIYYFDVNNMFFQFSDRQFFIAALTALFVTGITVFFLQAFFLAALGVVTKGDFKAYFFVEPNIFDAEDITAMGLSAHKSLLRALDTTGIDVTQLRLKQNFKGGRSGETV